MDDLPQISPSRRKDDENLKVMREMGRTALQHLREANYAEALYQAVRIETVSQNADSTFCNYIKGIAHIALGDLNAALTDFSGIFSQSRSIIAPHFDFFGHSQKKLVGLISGLLKTYIKSIPDVILKEEGSIELELDDKEKTDENSQDDTPLVLLNSKDKDPFEKKKPSPKNSQKQQMEGIESVLAPFVEVSLSYHFGFIFNFKDTLSLESQLLILENLESYNTKEFEIDPDNFDRERYFINGRICLQKELYSQAAAYFTAAFLTQKYKEAYQSWVYFYRDGDEIVFEPNYSFEQHYKVLQSMFVNNLITQTDFVNYLTALLAEVKKVKEKISVDEEVSADPHPSTISESALHSQDDPSSTAETQEAPVPQPQTLVPVEISPALSKEEKKLATKIEAKILTCDSLKKREIEDLVHTGDLFAKGKAKETRKKIYGETFKEISRKFFRKVSDLCWKSTPMKVAASLAVLPQLFIFIGSLFYFPFYYRSQKNLLRKWRHAVEEKHSNEQENDGPELTALEARIVEKKDVLDERRDELKERWVKKIRAQDNNPHGKIQSFFRPVDDDVETEDEVPNCLMNLFGRPRSASKPSESPSQPNPPSPTKVPRLSLGQAQPTQ